jgi:nifR3 family TIM-barrel protein
VPDPACRVVRDPRKMNESPLQAGFSIGGVVCPSRIVMAPLAGITNGPFRTVAREAGCRVFWTDMLAAEGLVRRRPEVMALLPRPGEPHPVAVQLFGADPASLAEAAAMARDAGADLIDLNMACPVSRVSGRGAGAALMRDPARAARIVEAVAARVDLPVTVKMRTGWDHRTVNAPDLARTVAEAGARAVIIHGRTRSQGFTGLADHRIAAAVALNLPIPVVASGDIATPGAAAEVLRQTGVAGVMVGRAAIGNPWIFGAMDAALQGGAVPPPPGDPERLSLVLRHLELVVAGFPSRRVMTLFRPHLAAYLRGRAEAAHWRRTLLAEHSLEKLERGIRAAFTRWE